MNNKEREIIAYYAAQNKTCECDWSDLIRHLGDEKLTSIYNQYIDMGIEEDSFRELVREKTLELWKKEYPGEHSPWYMSRSYKENSERWRKEVLDSLKYEAIQNDDDDMLDLLYIHYNI